jgi:hypothetical protein
MDFAFGITAANGTQVAAPLTVYAGNSVGGGVSSNVTVAFGQTTLIDGTILFPLAANAPVLVGTGANQETVTPTAVGAGSITSPTVAGQYNFTALFQNVHGIGDPVASATVGLQEAINFAVSQGGGAVVVTDVWVLSGGTSAMLAAAILPSAGNVIIEDLRTAAANGVGLQFWSNRPTGAAIAAPATPVSGNAGVLATTGGAYTNANFKVQYTYVTAVGGETLASSQLTIAAGASGTAILGGSGAPAETGAVGYRVYISAAAGSTGYLLGCTAANSLSGAAGIVQCGPLACFAIGTGWQSATPLTNANALVPGISTAFGTVVPQPSASLPLPFQGTSQAFSNVGSVTSSAVTAGMVQLPTGFLNFVGRTIRIKGTLVMTTSANTGTITVNVNLHSVYGPTKITPFTVTTASFAAAAAVISINFETQWTTATVGTGGTLEAHGQAVYNESAATAALAMMDFIAGASSGVDLTKQDCIEVTVANTTIQCTAGYLYALTVEVLA